MTENYLKWLQTNEFISLVDKIEENTGKVLQFCKPTQLGYAVVAAAMNPDEGI